MSIEAAEYMEAIANNLSLERARDKVPDLRWGKEAVLRIGAYESFACAQGIAALASCAPAEAVGDNQAWLSPELAGELWDANPMAKMGTSCPICYESDWNAAQEAVAHLNDYHDDKSQERDLNALADSLRAWAEQERSAEKSA